MLKNYLKIAFAVFMRRKFFTFVNLFGITFTLAILLVVAALLDHIFGGAPPEVHQRRTLGIYRSTLTSEGGGTNTALPSYSLLDRHLRDLPGVEKVSISSVFWKGTSYLGDQRVESFLKHTDAEFWEILRFQFVEGRPFTHDEVARADAVAVVNEATRERFFGGGTAVGKIIEVDGRRFRVVGVVENVPMLRLSSFSDIWVPQTTAPTEYDQPQELIGLYLGLVLARSRADFPQIRDEFKARMAAVDLSMHEPFNRLIVVPETTFDTVARLIFSQSRSSADQSARLLRWLMALAVLFMVLPTINLVNLNVSRIMERASEIGVRKAFGAPSFVLVGQFVVENVLLTLVGGLLAVGLTFAILGLISNAGWIPYADFHLNFRIFSYALLITLFFGLFSGVYPAWRMSRMNPVDALRGGKS
ncbi:MAG: FtsX-like permease family protein [bacterium]|nr:FtsX-like permease family protein [bacterium]